MQASPPSEELVCNRELSQALVDTARNVKMLPEAAAKAIQIADNPDAKVQDLAHAVGHDVKMTADILALANSPLFPVYACGKSISCVSAAITRLGFRQTKLLILVSCYSAMVNKLTFSETRLREKLTEHSFLTACICSELNKLFGLGIQGEEFTAGLLHDVGRLLLAVTLKDKFLDLDPLTFEEDEGLLEKETALIGTNHAEVGAWFLRRNQVTQDLVSVAQFHHAPADAVKYTRLVALVSTSDGLANFYQSIYGTGGNIDSEYSQSFDCSSASGIRLLETLGVCNAQEQLEQNWPEILETASQTSQSILLH